MGSKIQQSTLTLCCLLVLCFGNTGRCEERVINIQEDNQPNVEQTIEYSFVPGTVILLPDGRNIRIEERLPDGNLRAEQNIVINPEGKIISPGTLNGYVKPVVPAPKTQTAVEPQTQKPAPVVRPEIQQVQPKTEIVTQEPVQNKQLWQMMPLTVIPQTVAQAPEPERKKEAPKEDSKKNKEEKKPAVKKSEPKKPEAKQPEVKKSAKTPKPKVGEELRIPQEAAKTGKLDFLEGCWQGTRPEYYSKRTIRECFCFDKSGRVGKRRVIDPQGKRNCIGATRASLNSGGVLFITSDGASCSDGQRWGQAEMTCRGNGQKTPCSWVFKDAQGGKQSYTIPFIRVESCRR